ncbi:hypothetical protein EKL30_14780 [Candidimonas sp. SYP-B2681]|uniref:cytochrome b/b6 domain-containing protein n=1 Tax=Candidimonas sp. SYP-B2681 TaxID=2497686 RepID=UPI000F85D7F8|nr:cytochrome b/b6 domain-containing protein [Candidimonas sp. SYP-B2681]RTZ40958.1 hypothetical protein EKL30_14780 [Candidimonas sp. SYP-B2681]
MSQPIARIRVWDLPIRLFHWMLALCVIASFLTVKLGGLWMDWHARFGLITFGLIVFRLVWGLAGSHYARFAQFIHGPAAIMQYLRDRSSHIAGHNPLGAWSVVALLLLLAFQVFSGLFANDDVLTSGPLAFLNEDWSNTFTSLHKLNEWPIIAMVVLHIAAIVWYRLKYQEDLLSPMISGDANLSTAPTSLPAQAKDTWATRLGALALATIIAAAVWGLTTLTPSVDAFY